jgi:hypothetical protein
MSGDLGIEIFDFPDVRPVRSEVEGRGASRILVVMAAAVEDRPEEIAYLENIFKAVKLAPLLEHVFLLPVLPGHPVALSALLGFYACDTVLLFGCSPEIAGIRAPLQPYLFTRLANRQYLWSDSLSTIKREREEDKNEKAAALWSALKIML